MLIYTHAKETERKIDCEERSEREKMEEREQNLKRHSCFCYLFMLQQQQSERITHKILIRFACLLLFLL